MARRFSKHILHILPLLSLVGFSLVFSFSSPEEIIGFIGVDNAYALIFSLAFLGGLTTFSGVPYHLVLVALASGGLSPLLLGAAASFGVMLGDSTSYLVGYEGSRLMSKRMQAVFDKLALVKQSHATWLPILFFSYGSLVPFSNDIITIPMGFLRYPFWRVMIPLGLGNLVFNISLAFVAANAYEWLQHLPFF